MKRVFIFIAAITILAVLLFSYTVWKFPPVDDSGNILIRNLVFFGISGTLSITGVFTFIWYFSRRIFFKTDSPRVILRTALREGFFVALFVDGFLLLQKLEAITIVNILLLGLFFISLELYIGIKNREQKITETTPSP